MTYKLKHELFSYSYKPTTIDECVLPQELKKTFNNMLSDGNITNLLLSGSSGTGKTTVSNIIQSELNAEVLKFNGSDGSLNIETLREYLTDFVSSVSLNGEKIKLIVIDEADGLSNLIQQSLRNFMEKFSNTRFILTCNYPDKIIKPLHSRCAEIKFNFDKETTTKLLRTFGKIILQILDNEKIEYDIVGVKSVLKLFYPDQRRILNELQRYSNINNKIDDGIVISFDVNISVLFELLKEKDFTGIKNWLANNQIDPLYNLLYNNMENYLDKNDIPKFICCIGEAGKYHSQVPNQELNLLKSLVDYMDL